MSHRSHASHTAHALPVLAWAVFLASAAAQPADLHEKTDTIAAALTDLSVSGNIPPAPLQRGGWTPAGPVERYVVANLYDKINGRSELFMSYGVLGMAFVTMKNEADPSQFIDIFLYDQGTAAGAFGAFSVERGEDIEPLQIGRDGYRAGDDVFFWKGPYYASILGSGDEPVVHEAQIALARALAERLKDTDDTLWGLEVLPKENLQRNSVQYFMEDALSLSFLTNTFTAKYSMDGEEVTAFISRADSPEEASKRRARYLEDMRKYGDDVEELDGGFAIADMGAGFYDVVFQQDKYVAGVTAVSNRARALEAAQTLRKGIQ